MDEWYEGHDHGNISISQRIFLISQHEEMTILFTKDNKEKIMQIFHWFEGYFPSANMIQ